MTFTTGGDEELIARVGESDLVVMPAHVVRELPPRRVRRLAQALHDVDVDVVLVGGPHRLATSQRGLDRQVPTVAAHTDDA